MMLIVQVIFFGDLEEDRPNIRSKPKCKYIKIINAIHFKY
jgi:hypothetical protein